MKIPQFALLGPEPFTLQGIGTLKSPALKDITPNNMSNYMLYSLITNLLFAKNTEVVSIAKELGPNNSYNGLLEPDIESMSKYDLIVRSVDLREALCVALPLFFCNRIIFSKKLGFVVWSEDGQQMVGNINEQNYLLVEDLLKQLLHCESEYSEKEIKYSTDKAKELWEKVSTAEKEKSSVISKDYEIGNIVSKLSTCGIGYTVFNIYDLTVYQLYDQFSAYIQNRISQLSENAYAHNGGENFDMNSWLRK